MTSSGARSKQGSRAVILGSTLLLGVGAAAFTFLPEEILRAMGSPAGSPWMAVFLQLYGAALFGLAMSGWMVKDSIVGGVFGRSYVVGNTAHALVGALSLTRPAMHAGASTVLWTITIVYWVLAIVFGYLMFVAAP